MSCATVAASIPGSTSNPLPKCNPLLTIFLYILFALFRAFCCTHVGFAIALLWRPPCHAHAHLQVTTAPNGFVIRKMNLKDHDNFLASSNVQSVAHKNGWWDGKEPFDFTKAYAPTPESALVPLYVGRRIWRIFDLLAPSKKLDSRLGYVPAIPTYPFGITPDKRFDVHMIQQILRCVGGVMG